MTAAIKPASRRTPTYWVQNPAVDLIVGCGAWSAPLLLVSYLAVSSHVAAWAIVFYALALFFNYPHYMATIYRAYHTSEDFQKYRIFTVHITGLLLLTALLSHFYVRLLPWIFTLYLTWSPWHYSGQNYGLFMMFCRRVGTQPSQRQRRALYGVFVLSFLCLALTLHAGASQDPMFLSLGLPVFPVHCAIVALGLACVGLTLYGMKPLYALGVKAVVAPLTLLSTQFLWFLVPSVLSATGRFHAPQSRYSTGVLAIMHSAQYLWITSHYAKRQALTGSTRWRPFAYFAVLITGGIALFVPGPWLASRILHFDFTSSFLIFTSLVNLHHFILDGAIWKLRDGRIAGLLLNSQSRVTSVAGNVGDSFIRSGRWCVGSSAGARALRIAAASALILLAIVDQTRFAFVMTANHPWRLARAAALNPFDGTTQLRLAREAATRGDGEQAIAHFRQALAERPTDVAVRDQFMQYLVEQKRFADAFQLTSSALQVSPRDVDLLVNRGILAGNLGDLQAARESWERAIRLDPNQSNAQLYLAQSYDQHHQPKIALEHYRAYLERVAKMDPAMRPAYGVMVATLLRVADCQAQSGDYGRALHTYDNAAKVANANHDPRLESVIATSAADMQASHGDFGSAVRLYQQALQVDSSAQLAELETTDLLRYARLLRDHHLDDMAYACMLRAREVLKAYPAAPEFTSVEKDVLEFESAGLSPKLQAVRRHPDAALAQALSLPTN